MCNVMLSIQHFREWVYGVIVSLLKNNISDSTSPTFLVHERTDYESIETLYADSKL